MKVEELEAKVKTLENQLRTLQDIEEIKTLQRAYGYYLEHWMASEIVDLFRTVPVLRWSGLKASTWARRELRSTLRPGTEKTRSFYTN